jgi:hypothetical protein
MPARNCPLLGKWRIVEMELWDTDLLNPGEIRFHFGDESTLKARRW